MPGADVIGNLKNAPVMVVKARAATPTDLTGPHGGTTSTTTSVAPTPVPSPLPGEPATAATEAAPAKPETKLQPHIAMKAAVPHVIKPAPTPVAAALAVETKTSRVLPPVDQYGDWGCEETKTIRVSLALPAGADFQSATVDVINLDKAKSFQKLTPVFDPHTRTVTGAVEFRGLDRVFFNCPGGGHATVRLTTTVAARP